MPPHYKNKLPRKSQRYVREEIYDLWLVFNDTLNHTNLSLIEPPDNFKQPSHQTALQWAHFTRSLPHWMLHRILLLSHTYHPSPYLEESEVLAGRWSPVNVDATW